MRKALVYIVIFFQIGLIVSLIRGIQLAMVARTRVAKLETKKQELISRQAELEDRLAYVQSDYYVEKVAREELQMTKPGETLVIIPEEVLGESVENQEKTQEVKPNWQKWWEVIRGKGAESTGVEPVIPYGN